MVRAVVVAAAWSVDLVGLVWLGSAIWFAARHRGSLGSKIWHFFRTLLPEPWMLLTLAVVVVALHFVPIVVWRPFELRWLPLRVGGSLVVIISAAFMIWARLALGDMWAGRPMVQEHHELRTGGPYRLVRHPIYTGLIGATLGITLSLYLGPLLIILALVIGWLTWRVHVEDRMMVQTFGERYRDYQRRVPALIPLPKRAPA